MRLRILRKIRKEFDYQEYVEAHYAVKYTTANELRICCPNCDDYKFKCYINNEIKHFNCFKCDFNSGNKDVFDLVAKTENITRGQAMMKLSQEYADVAVDWNEIINNCKPLEIEEDEASFPKTFRYIEEIPGKILDNLDEEGQKPFWEYLFSRGLTEKEIRAVKIHYTPDAKHYLTDENGKFYGNIGRRAIIPIFGGEHKLVSWAARTIENANPKYFYCPNSEAARTFWPYVQPKNNCIVLTEGILDSLAVRRLGFSAYASFSKHISQDQINLLKQWGVESVILAWDQEAVKEIQRNVENLKMHFRPVFVLDYTMWPGEKYDAGDTLAWTEGQNILNKLLSEGLVDVESMEYIKWKIELTS